MAHAFQEPFDHEMAVLAARAQKASENPSVQDAFDKLAARLKANPHYQKVSFEDRYNNFER